MTMTHKEALRVAREAVRERMASMSQFLSLEDLYDEQDEIQIRAYIEARGLVLVPKEATTAMIAAACDVWGVRVDEDVKRNITEEIKVALAAAPDPFKDDTP